MIYKYEMACKEAGMSEETIAEIHRMFDADKKKLKRLNQRLLLTLKAKKPQMPPIHIL